MTARGSQDHRKHRGSPAHLAIGTWAINQSQDVSYSPGLSQWRTSYKGKLISPAIFFSRLVIQDKGLAARTHRGMARGLSCRLTWAVTVTLGERRWHTGEKVGNSSEGVLTTGAVLWHRAWQDTKPTLSLTRGVAASDSDNRLREPWLPAQAPRGQGMNIHLEKHNSHVHPLHLHCNFAKALLEA